MSDTIEQAKSHAVRYLTLIDDKPSPQGITAIDALISRVRTEAQREAFDLVEQEARRRADQNGRGSLTHIAFNELADFCAAYLTRQAQK